MRLRTLIVAFVAILFMGPAAVAQVSYDTVTATITDPIGNPYANAAFYITLVDSLGNPVSNATTPNGDIFNAKPVAGTTDATGYFSAGLVPNNILSKPSGTQWKIVISPPTPSFILTYAPPWTIIYPVSVTGNVDLSAQMSALAAQIGFVNLKTSQSTLIGTISGILQIIHGGTGASKLTDK